MHTGSPSGAAAADEPAVPSCHPLIRRPAHTYSIVARDPESGELGVAVQSHYFSVGSVVTWAEAGIGAVATQSMAKVDYGPEGLALMRRGLSAAQALGALVANDEGREVRQVAMVDARGAAAVHTGGRCIPEAGHLTGDGFSVQANLMASSSVWPAMKTAFESATGDLAERLVVALEAAEAAGGDIRGRQSAALLVVSGERSEKTWEGRLFDLRVEDHPEPLAELRRLLRLRRAYRHSDQAEELFVAGKEAEAAAAFAMALELAPEQVELRFWPAVALAAAGREEEAMPLFRETFARAPAFADLLPRLVPLGLFPDDAALMARILGQRTGTA